MSKYPRVLVISHNPFSDTQNNGKTLSAFFKGWPQENIAQIFLTLDKFDNTVCEKFYRFSDLEVLQKFISKKEIGKAFYKYKENSEEEKKQAHKNKMYIFIRNLFLKRIPLMYCLRNFIWKRVKPWENEKFLNWVKEYNPDIIFFQSSNVYAIFDMVENLCDKTKAKLIMETTDDYITSRFSIDPFFWINHFKLLKRYKKAVKKSKCVFAIGDMMAEEYTKRFGGNFKVAMNSVEIKEKVKSYDNINNPKIILTYAGNLGLNRWKVLSKIGKALENIKKENRAEAILEIYSIDRPKDRILKKLTIPNIMEFKGSLDSDGLIEKRNASDILVHVESFDRKNKYITRLSVSTKIPEYLLSERSILAVGPKEVASIQYIEKNEMGKVIKDIRSKNLEKELLNIIKDRKQRQIYILNGIRIAKERHSFDKNRNSIQKEIIDIK